MKAGKYSPKEPPPLCRNIECQQSGAKGPGKSLSPVIRTADVKSVADLFQTVKVRGKAFDPKAVGKAVDKGRGDSP